MLRLFFDSPKKPFQLREISRLLQLGMPSVRNHVKRLEKEGFVRKEKLGVYESYFASENEVFKIYKRNDMLLRISESGLSNYLEETFVPDAIVLFGSASRGEDLEGSDIDLFIMAKQKSVDLRSFENKLERKISIQFERRVQDLPKELFNNVINGIVIYGYLKVF